MNTNLTQSMTTACEGASLPGAHPGATPCPVPYARAGDRVRRSRTASILVLAVAVLLSAGCDTVEPAAGPGMQSFKVYNDTLANAMNPMVGISAGNGRLFVMYGTSSYGVYINGLLSVQSLRSRVMAVDNQGNFLWRRDLPASMDAGTVVALRDGGCLVAATNTWSAPNPIISKDYVYLFRFAHDGTPMPTDSVSLKETVSPYPGGFYINAITAADGRVLIFGDCSYPIENTNHTKGFAISYSPETGPQWLRDYFFPLGSNAYQGIYLTGGVSMPDGGFLISGTHDVWDSAWTAFASRPLLLRINAQGDIVWTRRFTGKPSIWPRNMVAGPGGTYRFCFNTFDTGFRLGAMHIYEINADGDSLASTTVSTSESNVISMLVATDDGGCVGLVNTSTSNTIGDNSGRHFRQLNTRLLRFDARLRNTSASRFQQTTTDFLMMASRTSDGRIACFGLMQQVGKTYYLPHIYFL